VPTEAELAGLIERAAEVAADWAAATDEHDVVAAAALLSSRRVHVGVWVEAAVDSACLCAETGPICEAHLARDPIVAIACVAYIAGEPIRVLPACGVCQERLKAFGSDVVVAVAAQPTLYKALSDLRPWPWWQVVPEGSTERRPHP
jgi:cytidine deaminase